MVCVWCIYCQLYFTICSSASIVNFEQVNAGWVKYGDRIKENIKMFTCHKFTMVFQRIRCLFAQFPTAALFKV